MWKLEATRTPFRHGAVIWIYIQGTKERPIQGTSHIQQQLVKRRDQPQRKPGWYHSAARVIVRMKPHLRRLGEVDGRKLRSLRWGCDD